jgi:hypothetical protein
MANTSECIIFILGKTEQIQLLTLLADVTAVLFFRELVIFYPEVFDLPTGLELSALHNHANKRALLRRLHKKTAVGVVWNARD